MACCENCRLEAMVSGRATVAGAAGTCAPCAMAGQASFEFVNPETTAERMDAVRQRYSDSAAAIEAAPRETVSRTFRRRFRQQVEAFNRWYARYRLQREARSRPAILQMVEAFNDELNLWRRQATEAGVDWTRETRPEERPTPRRSGAPAWFTISGRLFGRRRGRRRVAPAPSPAAPPAATPTTGALPGGAPAWTTTCRTVAAGHGGAAGRPSVPVTAGGSYAPYGLVARWPDETLIPWLQTKQTMGGLTQPNIVTPGDAWTAVLRSGPCAGGTARHIPPEPGTGLVSGVLDLVTEMSRTPVIAGQGEREPLVWTPQMVGERLDYVNRQWDTLEADVRGAEALVAAGTIPEQWKRSFTAALAEWREFYRDWYESFAPLLFGLLGYRDVATQTNNWLRRLIGWREQFVAYGGEATGPGPEEMTAAQFPELAELGGQTTGILTTLVVLAGLVALIFALK